MQKRAFTTFILFLMFFINTSHASLKVGVGTRDLTPPLGTPSAGHIERTGKVMTGIHDHLLATALAISNDEKIIVLCSVDHLGFLYSMSEEVIRRVHQHPGLQNCEIYIGASHTHSGGGAYFNTPLVGQMVAGPYDHKLRELYIHRTADAIVHAAQNLQPAKVGIGYGKTKGLISYNGIFPKTMNPHSNVTLLKVTKLDGSPLAVFFSTPIYPDVLKGDNMEFSADVIGSTRKHISSLLGRDVVAIFFNGSTGDIETNVPQASDSFTASDKVGSALAKNITKIWHGTTTSKNLDIKTFREKYLFEPKPTLSGFQVPQGPTPTEINLIVLNKSHAILTIPAELSCAYDPIFKAKGTKFGFKRMTISNLVNDAHGYIYTPEAWKLNPLESDFSFGGEHYGQLVEEKVEKLLKKASTKKQK